MHTTQKGWMRRLALLLLVLQGISGGVVSFAHASDRLNAPVHIEAAHGSACVALHDELRCALCAYAGSQLTSPGLRTLAPETGTSAQCPTPCDAPPPLHFDRRTAQPRAPPALRV